jgi:hypothetical protein
VEGGPGGVGGVGGWLGKQGGRRRGLGLGAQGRGRLLRSAARGRPTGGGRALLGGAPWRAAPCASRVCRRNCCRSCPAGRGAGWRQGTGEAFGVGALEGVCFGCACRRGARLLFCWAPAAAPPPRPPGAHVAVAVAAWRDGHEQRVICLPGERRDAVGQHARRALPLQRVGALQGSGGGERAGTRFSTRLAGVPDQRPAGEGPRPRPLSAPSCGVPPRRPPHAS